MPGSPKKDTRSDEALVAALNGGDLSAFDALYFRHRDWVVRLAHRFTANHADALDVMQETFLYLFGKFPGFILTCRLTSFLYPVVKNLAIVAKRRRHRHLSSEAMPETAAAPLRADVESSRNVFAAALARLPEAQSEVVLMRFVDEMSVADIAQALDIPQGTVKSRMHHALKALQADPVAAEHLRE